MAVALRSGKSRGRGGRTKRAPMSEINVTPMVDVMLVLLVIFMVTAPLLTSGVPVDLPKTNAAPITGQDEPLVVSINAHGNVFLQDTEIQLDSLAARIQAITQNKPETRVFVRGDRTINYGRIMEVMGTLNEGGIRRVALVGEQPAPGGAAGKKGTR